MHSRVAKVRHRSLVTIDLMVGFDANTAAVKPGQSEGAASSQASHGGTETGGTKGQ